jgi:hypothetical protein
VHTPPAPKSGSVGTRCAQTADASLSDFGTGDVSPSTGIHCNGNYNYNNNCNCNYNGNCRCAELRPQLSLRGQLRRQHRCV